MGINNRPGPGESVYRTRLGGGEATGEQDVEGHEMKLRANDDDDTQGHGMAAPRASGDEEDTEGHSAFRRAATGGAEEDTEGHASRPLVREGDEEDTEGHIGGTKLR